MTCLEFAVWFGSGVLIVPLMELLKKLPKVGPIFGSWAWLLAPLLAAILPQIAALAPPVCAVIDPALWAVVYMALAYLVSQILYWLTKKSGIVA